MQNHSANLLKTSSGININTKTALVLHGRAAPLSVACMWPCTFVHTFIHVNIYQKQLHPQPHTDYTSLKYVRLLGV